MTFHAGVHTFTVDAIVFCLIVCHAEKKHACFILMLRVTLLLKIVCFWPPGFDSFEYCKRGLVHGSRGKLAEISKSEVHILTMSQPALFLCSFLLIRVEIESGNIPHAHCCGWTNLFAVLQISCGVVKTIMHIQYILAYLDHFEWFPAGALWLGSTLLKL